MYFSSPSSNCWFVCTFYVFSGTVADLPPSSAAEDEAQVLLEGQCHIEMPSHNLHIRLGALYNIAAWNQFNFEFRSGLQIKIYIKKSWSRTLTKGNSINRHWNTIYIPSLIWTQKKYWVSTVQCACVCVCENVIYEQLLETTISKRVTFKVKLPKGIDAKGFCWYTMIRFQESHWDSHG